MIDTLNAHHSLGWFGFWFVAVPLLALGLVIAIGCLVASLRWDDEDAGVAFVASGIALLVVLGCTAGAVASYWPFNAQFHEWVPVSGTVAETNQRIITTGSGDSTAVSQRYVVRFTESDQLFGCDDTRCALAKKGDHLSLKCKKEYVYQSEPGWACNYNAKS